MATAEALVTIEVSGPHARYTLFESGPELDVHLAGSTETGGTGPCLCGFDRFVRGTDGRILHGFSVGGGVTGPGVRHNICAECARLAGDRVIRGIHAGLFGSAA